MSSRSPSQVNYTVTLILLLFGPCCWSFRLPTTAASADTYRRDVLAATVAADGSRKQHIGGDNSNRRWLNNNNRNIDEVPLPLMGEFDLNGDAVNARQYAGVTEEPVSGALQDLWTQREVWRFLQDSVNEHRIHALSSNLRNLLEEHGDEDLPIVYEFYGELHGDLATEDEQQWNRLDATFDGDDNNDSDEQLEQRPEKRSGRYYRTYPFKRRNNNRLYEHPQHNCSPSREEVVKLVIALHKYQNGRKNGNKMVKFCKRERPLGNIITNMRFLG